MAMLSCSSSTTTSTRRFSRSVMRTRMALAGFRALAMKCEASSS
jgi:hypothetical protein